VTSAEQPLAPTFELLELMQDGVFTADGEGRYTYANPAALRQVGYTLAELTRRSIVDLVVPEQYARLPDHLARMDAGELLSSEWLMLRKDGSRFHAELSTRRLPDGGYLAISRDISARKRSEQEMLEQQAIYRAIVDTPAEGFWMADLDGRLLEVNGAYARLSGYSREELLSGMRITDLEAQETREETEAHIHLLRERGYDRFRTLHRRRDGSVWPVEIVTTLHLELAGGCLFVFIEDISDKVQSERELRIAASVLETMEQAVVVTDAHNRIISVNPAQTRITGYTLDELCGQDPKVFASGRHDEEFYAQMWHDLALRDHWAGEIWDRKKSGEVYAKWLNINVLRNADGSVHQYISVFSDITEKKRSEELIWQQANFCPLTELPNRRMFTDRLEQAIHKARRSEGRLALLYIDLDHFKEINDTLGHSMGDTLLRDAAKRLVGCVRESDTVARLGGDEFTVLLVDLPSEQTVERVVQAILHKFVSPFQLGSEASYVTPSIGITLFPEDADDAESLLKNADQAMYAAKRQGRNGYHYFTPAMQEGAQFRMRQLRDLRAAVANAELRVYYQPIVDLADMGIRKAEALLRWQHPQRGLLGPGEFIALAEESGLIVELGNWVFREVIAQVCRWRERIHPEFQISVNKSPLQFRRDLEGGSCWLSQMQAQGLPGSGVVVEITEGSLMESNSQVRNRLIEFRERGIQVALDDFGTGYSSLAYLKRFDIDYLKIDQTFVRNMTADSDDLALNEAIIVMAHRLGIEVVAEGVETAEQLALLKAAGCDYAQGYYFSRPVPAQAFERLLQQQAESGLG